jgi:hypothetical protein
MKNKSLMSAFFMLALIVLLSTYKTEAFGQTIPKISIVSLDHVPFVEGDNNEFYISAKDYTGQVQYQLFYIQESVMKEWKLINNVDMVNGWTNPVDAQAPIIIDISNLNLKADKYRFAIRVRRVGVQGLKQNSYGDYDDVYPFNLDVAKNANIKLGDNINIERVDFSKNESLVINGVGNLSNDVQYKLHLFDVKNNKWLTDLTEYNTSINYSLKNIPEGIYIVDLWVKNSQSKSKYDGWKLKVINISNTIIKDIPIVKEVSEITLGLDNVVMNANKTKELSVNIKPEDATNKEIKWTSSNINIVSVKGGVLTARALGKATITATSNNGKIAEVGVYVSSNAADGVRYISPDVLGEPKLSDDELRKIKGNAEEMKKQIKTVADLIGYLRVNKYSPDERGDSKINEGSYQWHHNRPSESTIKLNTGNCGATASLANYILKGNYDEAGFIDYSEYGGGHVYNYIIQGGKVYIIDFLQYLEGNPSQYNRQTIIEEVDSFEQYATYYINRYKKGIKFFVRYTADEVLPIGNGSERKMMYYQKGANVTSFYETLEENFVLEFIDPPTKFPNWN